MEMVLIANDRRGTTLDSRETDSSVAGMVWDIRRKKKVPSKRVVEFL